MSSIELGANAFRKADIEAWMPAEQIYGEISSVSNCTDYQSSRLNIRWKMNSKSEPIFAHTLNGTAVAIPRLIKAILETHQQKDGSVILPSVLWPYMNGVERLTLDESYELYWVASMH